MYTQLVICLKRYLKKALTIIWNIFINGFFTLLPLCVTIAIFSFSFGIMKNLLSPLQKLHIPYLHLVPHSEFLIALILIFLAGFFLRSFLLQAVLAYCELLIARIPLVRPIYLNIKQIVDAFSPSDNPTFKKILLLEFPRKGMYSIGFLTSEFPPQLTPEGTAEIYYSVFIPMTPNPTNGFFVVVPQSECTELALGVQEAMTLVMSGGIILPEKLRKNEEIKKGS